VVVAPLRGLRDGPESSGVRHSIDQTHAKPGEKPAITGTDMQQLAEAPLGPRTLEEWIAPDCRGLNFYEIDRSLQSLQLLYMSDDERAHMAPHYARLGGGGGDGSA
jgi:hypothetical protein